MRKLNRVKDVFKQLASSTESSGGTRKIEPQDYRNWFFMMRKIYVLNKKTTSEFRL